MWMRFSSLIRMICTQGLCDGAGKFPHLTLPLTEQFDLCGYYSPAQPDKQIIAAERKGNVFKCTAPSCECFISFRSNLGYGLCIPLQCLKSCMSSFIAFFLHSLEPEAEISPLSLILNLFLIWICTNTWFVARPAHSGCALFDLYTVQRVIEHANKTKRQLALHKHSLQGHLHRLSLEGDVNPLL